KHRSEPRTVFRSGAHICRIAVVLKLQFYDCVPKHSRYGPVNVAGAYPKFRNKATRVGGKADLDGWMRNRSDKCKSQIYKSSIFQHRQSLKDIGGLGATRHRFRGTSATQWLRRVR